MDVKFTDVQIQALAQIEVKANQYFDEDLRIAPYQYKEFDRSRMVSLYMTAILRNVVKDGVIYGV